MVVTYYGGKEMLRKQLGIIALFVLLAVAIVGCGNDSKDEANENEGTTTESSTSYKDEINIAVTITNLEGSA